jgi:penicillin V acylase-like amidase (Ntn superfamily)
LLDSQRETASIEFIKGEAVIHSGEQMPVRVMCNAAYAKELNSLKNFVGFGARNQLK